MRQEQRPTIAGSLDGDSPRCTERIAAICGPGRSQGRQERPVGLL